MRIRRWNVADVPEDKAKIISSETGLSELVSRILLSRNPEHTPESVMKFIANDIEFESPFNIKDMDKAVERIHLAIENGEKIAIYGDYDCDGITSTALLIDYFDSVGGDAFYYIPDRETEGYGMNMAAVKKLSDMGTSLIVTVDNGITAHEEVEYAAELGMDVVITDHHTPRPTLPQAVAVVNPHRDDCNSQFKDYAGVGVAFQLICALEEADPLELLDYYADLVAIGTLADLVPLYGANRKIAQRGIEHLEHTHRLGISALMNVGGLTPPLTAESVSFGIAPRINAAGRMGRVKQAVELLITDDEAQAAELAGELGEMNLQRRGVEEKVLEEIKEKLRANPALLLERVLIVSGEGWHQGVMGIVASRLLERCGKPVIVFSVNDGVAKGSGRSLPGFSLIDAITNCSEHLTHFGGHTLAAGMTISEEHLPEFNSAIQKYAKLHYKIMPVPSYDIDCILKPNELTIENIESLSALAPFGAGNSSPVFVLNNLKLTGIFPTADNKHIRLRFLSGEREINTIYFRMPPHRFPYENGAVLDAVVEVDINEWNGSKQLSIKIKDIRKSGFPQEEAIESYENYLRYRRGESTGQNNGELIPTRDEFGIIYRHLRSRKSYPYGAVALWEELLDYNIGLAKTEIILDIFAESRLIDRAGGKITVLPQKEKVNLEQTATFKLLHNIKQ